MVTWLSDRHKYYLAHRSEIVEYHHAYHLAHRSEILERKRRKRLERSKQEC
jgi:hypothetical protein